MRPRNPQRNRRWRVQNELTGAAYEVVPGANDGVASQMFDAPFGRGDVWALIRRPGENSDGVNFGCRSDADANIDQFNQGASLSGDVVIWYGAHVLHDPANDPPGKSGEWVGPVLQPVSWPPGAPPPPPPN